ncbi:MAG: hypothetical protein Q4G69_06340 [Planctomycetia bacterium]|nr:hypothetical protein [Planctomycetia bacterium]
MIKLYFWISLLFLFAGILEPGFLAEGYVRADDTIWFAEKGEINSNKEEKIVFGSIRSSSPDEVFLVGKDQKSLLIPTVFITAIQYDSEPTELTTARLLIQTSLYREALEKLTELDADTLAKSSANIQQEAVYLRLLAKGNSLLINSTLSDRKSESLKTGREIAAFLDSAPRNVHCYELADLGGRIFLLAESPEEARLSFDRMIKAGAPEVRFAGLLQIGEILLRAGEIENAQRCFNEVLCWDKTSSEQVEEQKLFAKIGNAEALALKKSEKDSIDLFHDLIRTTNSSNVELWARMYNGLGTALLHQQRNREALLAFLHVDLLYSQAKGEHVRALRSLYHLWNRQKRTDRANEVLKTLEQKYEISIAQ